MEGSMIDPGMVLLIRRLLAEGSLTQRAIARQTGVSRVMVAKIASGKRPDYVARREARQRERNASLDPVGPPRRCPSCGGFVFTPCLLCRVRAAKERDRASRRLRQGSAA
jgi:transcriptional regulator with XRE-family HTH domain